MKKRGRPANPPKTQEPFWTSSDIDLERRNTLSKLIAAKLRVPKGILTDKLAEVAAGFECMREVRYKAPLAVKRRGNRPNIHLATLLRDCALVLQEESGRDAEAELRRICGWAEDNWEDSTVLNYARAVMASLRIKHPQSLRQQARQAIKYL
ncbi:MAG: hypothetical protein WBX11_15245 [Thiobacillaceae bacterium]